MKSPRILSSVLLLASVHWVAADVTITTQPKNATVSVGATAQFTVTATSTAPPLTYQWWFKETALDAAANPSAATRQLSLTNVTLAEAGPDFVVVSDTSGSVTSQVATLTVDATSTKITTGPVATNQGHFVGCAWGDYDRDGFLDLFVATASAGYLGLTDGNSLYRNQGDGTFTKVRVKATIGGKTFWQMREISGGNGCQNDLRAHFGLGDSTNVTMLRIEWPSGVVQEFTDVAAKQFLTIWEPPALRGAMLADGSCQLTITAEPNRAWQIQASTDLKTWQALTTVTPATAVSQYTDANAVGMACRFYSVVAPGWDLR